MTQSAQDATGATTAGEWKAHTRTRRLNDPTLASTRLLELTAHNAALKSLRQLQSSGALARATEQATAMQRAIGRSLALRAIERMQRTLVVSSPAQALILPNPVIEAAVRFQQTQVDRLMPSFAAAQASLAEGLAQRYQVSAAWQTININITRQLDAMMKPLQDSLRTTLDRWVREWGDLARLGGGVLRGLARAALNAALRARQAVLHGRTDELDAFIRDWLDQPVTPWRRDAVAVVLLEDDWLPTDLDNGVQVLHRIKGRASVEARNHKFIEDTQLRGHRVVMLDQPRQRPGGETTTLADLLVDPASKNGAPISLGYSDDRLNRLLGRLDPKEQAVVAAYGGGRSETWESAAVAVGLPPEFGERVRRKCKRERNVLADRAAAVNRAVPPGSINYGRR